MNDADFSNGYLLWVMINKSSNDVNFLRVQRLQFIFWFRTEVDYFVLGEDWQKIIWFKMYL